MNNGSGTQEGVVLLEEEEEEEEEMQSDRDPDVPLAGKGLSVRFLS